MKLRYSFDYRLWFLLLLLFLLLCGIFFWSREAKLKNTVLPQAIAEEPLLPPAAAAEPIDPFADTGISCDEINRVTEDTSQNPYLNAAFMEDREAYNYFTAVQQFLVDQDEAFSGYIESLSGTDLRCGLSRPDVDDALADRRIEPLPQFAAERFRELRQIDCALYHMRETGKLICPYGEEEIVMPLTDAFACEKRTRENIAKARTDLRMATRIALLQIDEMAMAWPLHKRLECLNDKLTDLRKQLIEFLTVFAKLPPALINAAQSR